MIMRFFAFSLFDHHFWLNRARQWTVRVGKDLDLRRMKSEVGIEWYVSAIRYK